jgi:hypothetical protein
MNLCQLPVSLEEEGNSGLWKAIGKGISWLENTSSTREERRAEHLEIGHGTAGLSIWNPYQILPSDVCRTNYF